MNPNVRSDLVATERSAQVAGVYEHQKEYLVLVDGEPSPEALRQMLRGVKQEGELLRADAVERLGRLGPQARRHGWEEAPKGRAWLRVVLHEGKKRHIRRLCAALGHPVHRLIRTRIGGVELGDLPAGKCRYLTPEEVRKLVSG